MDLDAIHKELSKMEKAVRDFRIRGTGVSGNFAKGFAHKPTPNPVDWGQGQMGVPPPSGCDPCAPRHLHIRVRMAGSFTQDCSLSTSMDWDFSVTFDTFAGQCAGGFSELVTFAPVGSPPTCFCSGCTVIGDCVYQNSVYVTLVGGHSIHLSYGPAMPQAYINANFHCGNGSGPHDVGGGFLYEADEQGYPPLPPDIVIPDWCAAAGHSFFSSYNWFPSYVLPGNCEDCAFNFTDQTVNGVWQTFIYVDVT